MTLADTADQYFTYESRLTSFQTAQQLSKRRTSNANSNTPKTLKWPHQSPSAEEVFSIIKYEILFLLTNFKLAKAGFFYNPTHANPDNVVCFLCHKSLDGWEEDDDPVAEHLKHSADCGWAIVAAVESQDGNFSGECPTSTRMIDARRATFADKWPHENKKGWKCKIKQVELPIDISYVIAADSGCRWWMPGGNIHRLPSMMILRRVRIVRWLWMGGNKQTSHCKFEVLFLGRGSF